MHGLKFSLMTALALAMAMLVASCDDAGEASREETQSVRGSSFDEAPLPQKTATEHATDDTVDEDATIDDLLEVDNPGPTNSGDILPELTEALNPDEETGAPLIPPVASQAATEGRSKPIETEPSDDKADTAEPSSESQTPDAAKEAPAEQADGKQVTDAIKLDETKEYPQLSWKILSGYTYVPEGLTIQARPQHEIKPGPDGQTPAGDAELRDALKQGEDLEKFDKVPQRIRNLSDRKVEIRGYMIPIDFAQDGTNQFALMELLPDCYYCSQPMPNQFIEVRMKDKRRVEYIWDRPVRVRGVIEVEPLFEEGFFINLYRLEGVEVLPINDE